MENNGLYETEESGQQLLPFTDASLHEDTCAGCEHKKECLVLKYVNKLSVKRDGEGVEDKFSCSLFTEGDIA